MKIINKRFSKEAFNQYIRDLKIKRPVKRIILHHTSSPVESWHGSGSMLHYWNLYRSRGWKSGPHIFIAPDGIWVFTPLNKRGRGVNKVVDKNAIHIEIVGRYVDKLPENQDICLYTANVIQRLFEKFGVNELDINTHYYYDNLSNCSPVLSREWARQQVLKFSKFIK